MRMTGVCCSSSHHSVGLLTPFHVSWSLQKLGKQTSQKCVTLGTAVECDICHVIRDTDILQADILCSIGDVHKFDRLAFEDTSSCAVALDVWGDPNWEKDTAEAMRILCWCFCMLSNLWTIFLVKMYSLIQLCLLLRIEFNKFLIGSPPPLMDKSSVCIQNIWHHK